MQLAYFTEVKEYTDTISSCSFVSSEHFCPGGKRAAYLAACRQGSAFVRSAGGETVLSAGLYAVIDGNDSFTVFPRQGGRVFLLPVNPEGKVRMNTALPLSREGTLILDMLSTELLQRKAGYCAVAAGLITRLLDETIAKRKGSCASLRPAKLSIGDISEYIANNCADVSLRSVAAHFYYHPNTLSRFIRRECGMSFTDFSREVRLRQASGLLLETSLSVYRIAELCGYHNITHFYNLFFKMLKKTPDQYRREGRG